jgi:hypothetical protein
VPAWCRASTSYSDTGASGVARVGSPGIDRSGSNELNLGIHRGMPLPVRLDAAEAVRRVIKFGIAVTLIRSVLYREAPAAIIRLTRSLRRGGTCSNLAEQRQVVADGPMFGNLAAGNAVDVHTLP